MTLIKRTFWVRILNNKINSVFREATKSEMHSDTEGSDTRAYAMAGSDRNGNGERLRANETALNDEREGGQRKREEESKNEQ